MPMIDGGVRVGVFRVVATLAASNNAAWASTIPIKQSHSPLLGHKPPSAQRSGRSKND
jgi:hypothetical protein